MKAKSYNTIWVKVAGLKPTIACLPRHAPQFFASSIKKDSECLLLESVVPFEHGVQVPKCTGIYPKILYP